MEICLSNVVATLHISSFIFLFLRVIFIVCNKAFLNSATRRRSERSLRHLVSEVRNAFHFPDDIRDSASSLGLMINFVFPLKNYQILDRNSTIPMREIRGTIFQESRSLYFSLFGLKTREKWNKFVRNSKEDKMADCDIRTIRICILTIKGQSWIFLATRFHPISFQCELVIVRMKTCYQQQDFLH